MGHIILLGDSIFDNSRYVQPKPDVRAQLQDILPTGWNVTLRAVDGAVAKNVINQLANLPDDTTHLVLSVGGNDLLGCARDLLGKPVTVSSEAFLLMARVTDAFESTYRRVVETCLKRGLPLVLCTIYNGNFDDKEFQAMARVAVAAFNDAILRLSREKGLCAIDLRAVCTTPQDFANPIEPSAIGGQKIAQAIWQNISS